MSLILSVDLAAKLSAVILRRAGGGAGDGIVTEFDSRDKTPLRFLQEIEIPKRFHGRLMDACFKYISVPGEAIAVKAFALSVLGKLSAIYPEIIPEIKLLIEENYERETAAFKSRAKKFLYR